jgi:hypothetical protein
MVSETPAHLKLFRLLATMLLVSALLPLVFNNLPPVVRSHHIWTALWGCALFFFRPGVLFTKTMLLVMVNWVIVLCIANDVVWVNMDEEAKRMIYLEYYEIAVALSVITYFRESRDYEGLARVVRVALICIVITALMSVFVSYINPMFARDIIGVENASITDKEEILSFKQFGGGGYGFYSGIICLLPILIYYYKNPSESIWSRKVILFFIVLFCYCLLRVQIFANLLIAVLIMVLSLVGTKKLKKSLFFMVVVSLILYLLPSEFYIDLLTNLSSLFPRDSHVRFKLEDMALFIRNGAEPGVDTEAAIRVERFPLLWESFSDEPFTGGKYYNHHLYWMNKLATFGLLGFLPFVILLLVVFTSEVRRYPPAFRLYLLLAIFSMIFLGVIKALFGRDLWYIFFIIAPGLYYTKLLKEEPGTEKKKVPA